MKKVTHRSVIPIYVAAGIWLIAALLLPMYRMWHYALYALLAVGGYFAARHFFPGTVEEIPIPQAPPSSGDAQVDELILSARKRQEALSTLGGKAADPAVRAAAARLDALCGKILTALEKDPDRLSQTKKFLSYYLPTTVSLLERYLELEQLSGETIADTREKIRAMLQKVETAFQAQLERMYQADTMDISADIQVMQQMMASEGLLTDSNDKNGPLHL